MKKVILLFGLLIPFCINAQTKGKIIPVDKTILKLSEDTTEKIITNKISSDFDYVIVINKETNKKDTILVYRDLYVDKKRKSKN